MRHSVRPLQLVLRCGSPANPLVTHPCRTLPATSYDRLKTQTLSFTASPGFQAGAVATIHTTGSTDLHVPFVTGAWQVRIYELGFAHSIDTAFGNLADALKFTDPKVGSRMRYRVIAYTPARVPGVCLHCAWAAPKRVMSNVAQNTTYEFTASFTLPAAMGSSTNFTASLISTDQSKATYNCLELQYTYDSAEEEVEAPKALTVTDGPHFWSCGTSADKMKVQKITISPPTPKAGEEITIAAVGTSSEQITGGKLKYVAGLDGIPLIHGSKDLCTVLKDAHINCPVAAGPVDIGYSVKLPSFVPAGNYSATAHAYDQDNNELLCMTGYFVLA